MATNVMSNDSTICSMSASLVRAGDRPPALRCRDWGGAGIGSTLDSLQQ